MILNGIKKIDNLKNWTKLTIFIALLVLPLSSFAGIQSIDTITVVQSDTTINLSHKFVIPSTVSILPNENISINSMQINSLNGTISGIEILNNTTLVIIYEFLDLEIPIQQIVNKPPRIYSGKENQQKEILKTTPVTKINSQENYDFLKSGTIFRGISLGDQSGMSLQSGLNLELEGKISDDISIIGALTDQNIPIQPEGNTQTLNEIDKVFIKVDMPREDITFGDYELSLSEKGFNSYSRKLQGFLAESNRFSGKTTLGGAVTKGQYHSVYFLGEEGNQGPYQLKGKDGEIAIIVLAGTEKVWINSILMKRGENNDYIIDYSTGEITFTTSCLITSESRITVDFQYSNLVYQKNIWLANNSTSLQGNKLNISTSIINEIDDKENPIEIAISEDDKKHLAKIGDKANTAFQSTIVEDSLGSYILQDSKLIFVGTNMGTHSAVFYNVGDRGYYKKVYSAEYIYFEWIDKNSADVTSQDYEMAVYLPARPLKLPSNHKQYNFSTSWNPSENFSIKSEIARSDFDVNTFSDIDDNNNSGNAINIESSFKLPINEKLGTFSLEGKIRQIGENFDPIDRNQEVEHRRKWDLDSDSTQGEKYYESSLNYNLKEKISFSLDGGSYKRGDLQSDRYKIKGSFKNRFVEQCDFFQEEIKSSNFIKGNSRWTRKRIFSRFEFFKLNPYMSFYQEEKNVGQFEDDSFKFFEQTYGIQSEKFEKFRWKFETFLRQDDTYFENSWQDKSIARNLIFNGELIDWKTFSAEWNFTNRKKEYFIDNQSDIQFSLMSMVLKQQPKKLPVNWESNIKIEEERTVKKELRYYYVGEGKGQYLYDSTFADYYPHAQGDYILRILPSNIKEPVTSIRNGLRINFNGARIEGLSRKNVLKNISTLTDIRMQQQIKNENPLEQIQFSISGIDTNWAFFSRIIQQDINYRLSSIRGYLRFRFYNGDRISQLDVRGREKNLSRKYSLRYKGEFVKKTKLDSEISIENTIRESDFNILRNRDIFSLKSKYEISYLLHRIHNFQIEFIINKDEQKANNNLKAFLNGFKGSYERRVRSKGKVKFFTEIDNVKVTPAGNLIPWEMSNGKQEGLTYGWGASLEYRIGRNLSTRINYEGWNEPVRGLYNIGSAELRAMF